MSQEKSTLRVSKDIRKRVNNLKNKLDLTQDALVSQLLDHWESPTVKVFKKTKNDIERVMEDEDIDSQEKVMTKIVEEYMEN